LGGLTLVGIGSSASAATTVGETFAGAELCYPGQTGVTFLQTGSPGNQYRVNDFGVITSWSYQAGSAPFSRMQLKLGNQPQSGAFVIVDESDIETPVANTLNTFKTQIPISDISELGPILGFWASSGGGGANCVRTAAFGYGFIAAPGNVPLNYDPRNWLPGQPYTQLDVSAVLEPDVDNDDFGDESQDTCVPPAVRTDCDPPETTITKILVQRPRASAGRDAGPATKMSTRKATFKFTSDESASTFECWLNKKKFKPCRSPFRKRVRAGRTHRFKVRATDRGGNVDPTPAKRKFSVAG